MSKGRVDGSTPRQPVDVNPPAGPALRRSGDAAPPVIDEAKARFVTGSREVEGAFPVAPVARGSGLTERQIRALKVMLTAAAAAMNPPRRDFGNSGGSDPNSGVG
jgi:hypothetical protein